jgi:hypothetical protein
MLCELYLKASKKNFTPFPAWGTGNVPHISPYFYPVVPSFSLFKKIFLLLRI